MNALTASHVKSNDYNTIQVLLRLIAHGCSRVRDNRTTEHRLHIQSERMPI